MPQHQKQPGREDLRRTAESAFDWESFRPGQLEAMEAAVQGRDVLAVMPTGYGKSAVYQVPSLALPGAAVVISPLIALQRDQVDDINAALGGERAFALNSAATAAEQYAAWAAAESGAAKFLFLAPEQLVRQEVSERLRGLDISLLVVDEAHCISSWGHDFRPDYLRLGAIAEDIAGGDRPPTVALTATAATPVQAEIIERLGLRDPYVTAQGFDRPNLGLAVVRHPEDEGKRRAVVEQVEALCRDGQAPGLVYVGTRKETEYYAGLLADRGLRADGYHAGRTKADRQRIHEQFLEDGLDVVVATNAFGMGIDKPNVRFVVHADIPDSLDSYHQEIGRAGRDGAPAQAVLHYRPEDLGLRRFFAAKHPDEDALRTVVEVLGAAQEPLAPAQLREDTSLSARKLTTLLNLLEQVQVPDSGGAAVIADDAGWRAAAGLEPAAVVAAAVETAEARQRIDQSRVEMARQYAESDGCRRQFLLGYFGEQLEEPCGNCDNCQESDTGTLDGAPPEASAGTQSDGGDFPSQTAVMHREWGPGVVMSQEEDTVTVLFEQEGYRTLSLALLAEKKDILTRR